MTIRLGKWLCALLAACGLDASTAARTAPIDLGAELYEVQAGRPAALVGMQVGDVVLAWRADAKGAGSGTIRGAADLTTADMQWSDLGAMTLRGRSGDAPKQWRLRGNGWGIKLRPVATGDQRTQLQAALADLDQGKAIPGCARLLPLAEAWAQDGRRADEIWARWRCLEERIRQRDLRDIDTALAALWPVANPDERVQLGLLAVKLAGGAYDITDWALLERLLGFAEAAFPAGDPRPATLAALRRGKATVLRGQFAEVLSQLEPVARTLRQVAPNSLRLAAVQNEIAWANLNLDHLAEAEKILRNTLEIARSHGLNDVDLSKYQGHLGMVLNARNDLDGAEREITQALERLIAVQAGDKFIAPVWNNLGVIRRDRGDYVGAEDAFRETIAMEERRAPGWVAVAIAYGNMAAIARARGDLEKSQRWAEKARPILQKAVPEGTEVAQNLHLLGGIALDRGRLGEAEDWYGQAIAVWEKIAPQTQRHSLSIEQTGVIAQKRGDPATARARFETALAIRQKSVPGGLDESWSWYRIGALELDEKRFELALAALEKAVAIGERLSPDAINHANALNALGRTQQALGQIGAARTSLCRAADVLDRLRARISRDPKEQAEAMAQFARIRQDCVAAEIAAGHLVAAFETLERGRGRALQAILAQRDLTYAVDLPPALRREWAGLEADIERLRRQRSVSTGTDAPADAALQERMQALQSQRGRLIERIRAQAPRFAALQFPAPPGFAELRARLSADTAMVAFVVGPAGAYAFVVRADTAAPIVHKLDLTTATLGGEVAALRAALQAGGRDSARVSHESSRWYARIIAPIAADLSGANRLVLLPDAELYTLPFATLVDERGRFLIEKFSLTVADSASLWAGAGSAEARASVQELVAVANGAADGGALQPLVLRGAGALPALPFARAEVEGISALAQGHATVLTDASATEARVERLAHDAGRLHFAVHSLFDPVSPLESGLVLRPDPSATGAGANGLLQVWEIFNGWRTSAQLVTLSGCDTGQGASLADEGLIGLTRAFQFAGARNVVASLWSVSDRSTAELMTRFYRELGTGADVDRALRTAQVAMLRDTRARSPLSPAGDDPLRGVGGLIAAPTTAPDSVDWTWAAFQVYGGR